MDIGAEIDNLKPKVKTRFVKTLMDSIRLLNLSVKLRGPYRLVVDSNVLMRIEGYKNGEIKEGLLTTLVFFEFLKRFPFHIDVVVRPSVFYEYLRKKNINSSKEHWENFKEVKNLIEDQFDIVLFFDGIETFSAADEYIKKIKNDEQVITSVLREYEERNWKFDFIRGGGGFAGFVHPSGMIEVPPLFAADGLYEELEFEYFHEGSLRRFFIEHIAKKISDYRDNDQRVVQKYEDGYTYLLAKLLHLSGRGELLGLGDADIFSICNIQSQFTLQAHGRYRPASIALTLDGGLLNALHHFSTLHISSGEVLGGKENLEDGYAKFEAFELDQRRFAEGEKRAKHTMGLTRDFLKELDSGKFS